MIPSTSVPVCPMFGILKFVYPDGNSLSQTTVATFLEEMSQTSAEFNAIVRRLLSNFAESEPIRFNQSVLRDLHEKLMKI